MDPTVENFVNAFQAAPTADVAALFDHELAEATADSVEGVLCFLRKHKPAAAEQIEHRLEEERQARRRH